MAVGLSQLDKVNVPTSYVRMLGLVLLTTGHSARQEGAGLTKWKTLNDRYGRFRYTKEIIQSDPKKGHVRGVNSDLVTHAKEYCLFAIYLSVKTWSAKSDQFWAKCPKNLPTKSFCQLKFLPTKFLPIR